MIEDYLGKYSVQVLAHYFFTPDRVRVRVRVRVSVSGLVSPWGNSKGKVESDGKDWGKVD